MKFHTIMQSYLIKVEDEKIYLVDFFPQIGVAHISISDTTAKHRYRMIKQLNNVTDFTEQEAQVIIAKTIVQGNY